MFVFSSSSSQSMSTGGAAEADIGSGPVLFGGGTRGGAERGGGSGADTTPVDGVRLCGGTTGCSPRIDGGGAFGIDGGGSGTPGMLGRFAGGGSGAGGGGRFAVGGATGGGAMPIIVAFMRGPGGATGRAPGGAGGGKLGLAAGFFVSPSKTSRSDPGEPEPPLLSDMMRRGA